MSELRTGYEVLFGNNLNLFKSFRPAMRGCSHNLDFFPIYQPLLAMNEETSVLLCKVCLIHWQCELTQ